MINNRVFCEVSIAKGILKKDIKYIRYPFANYWFNRPLGMRNKQKKLERIVNGYELFIPEKFTLENPVLYEFRVKERELFGDGTRVSSWSAISSEFGINYYASLGQDWYLDLEPMNSEGIKKFYDVFEFRYCGILQESNDKLSVYDSFNDIYKVINPNTLEVELNYRKINNFPSEKRFDVKDKFDALYSFNEK
ncbi:hypothetical protein KHA96_20125 [Bacillus sp. FJAT-49711]|uniref:hypothetical protein n=1 Tax=Bacillus sp. FJAT-49711 TaxID=2833585 RepID=UPI001BC9B3CD|nr:hypothetical protein [Bacillus sp. FJAT-49711]MBS4220607.1 hypothetical protein [Bacillus sp. FJAT-49711]